jgi:hypothetical protein
MTLAAIQEAIKHLPKEERRKLAGWFEGVEEVAWDEEVTNHRLEGGGCSNGL